jgi:hypothetical protein
MTGRGGDDDRSSPAAASRPSPPRPPLDLPDPPLSDPTVGIALRPWRRMPGDVAALAAAWADAEIVAHTAVPDDRSTAAAERWIRSDPARRAAGLCLDLVVAPLAGAGRAAGSPATGRAAHAPPAEARQVDRAQAAGASWAGDAVLGEVGLRNVEVRPRRAEIGWWIAAAHRGRGLAVAATRLLTDWALSGDGGFDQVWARIDPGNPASARVAGEAGFVLLGTAGGAAVWSRTRT